MFVAQLSSVHLYNDQINEKIKMNMTNANLCLTLIWLEVEVEVEVGAEEVSGARWTTWITRL